MANRSLSELPVLLNEECAEVSKIVCKYIRFGANSFHPEDPEKTTNIELLHRELGDVMAVFSLLVSCGFLSKEKVMLYAQAKVEKLTPQYGLISKDENVTE